MKEQKNLEIAKQEVISLIKQKGMALYKKTILQKLTEKGLKKTNVSKALSELRKEKIIALYRKRWAIR